jgi:hypothetical protein
MAPLRIRMLACSPAMDSPSPLRPARVLACAQAVTPVHFSAMAVTDSMAVLAAMPAGTAAQQAMAAMRPLSPARRLHASVAREAARVAMDVVAQEVTVRRASPAVPVALADSSAVQAVMEVTEAMPRRSVRPVVTVVPAALPGCAHALVSVATAVLVARAVRRMRRPRAAMVASVVPAEPDRRLVAPAVSAAQAHRASTVRGVR